MMKLMEKTEMAVFSPTSAFAGVLYNKFIFAFKLIIGAIGVQHCHIACC
jgi:hypothetical protein